MEKLTDKESFELEYSIKIYIESLERMRETAVKACEEKKDYQSVVDDLDLDLFALKNMQKKICYAIENKII